MFDQIEEREISARVPIPTVGSGRILRRCQIMVKIKWVHHFVICSILILILYCGPLREKNKCQRVYVLITFLECSQTSLQTFHFTIRTSSTKSGFAFCPKFAVRTQKPFFHQRTPQFHVFKMAQASQVMIITLAQHPHSNLTLKWRRRRCFLSESWSHLARCDRTKSCKPTSSCCSCLRREARGKWRNTSRSLVLGFRSVRLSEGHCHQQRQTEGIGLLGRLRVNQVCVHDFLQPCFDGIADFCRLS